MYPVLTSADRQSKHWVSQSSGSKTMQVAHDKDNLDCCWVLLAAGCSHPAYQPVQNALLVFVELLFPVVWSKFQKLTA